MPRFWQVAALIYEKQIWNMQMSFVWSRCLVLFARIQSVVSWGSCMQCMSKGLFEVWRGHGDATQSLMFTPAFSRSLQRHFGLLWHCFQGIVMEKQADPITMGYLIQLAYLYQSKCTEASGEIQMTPHCLHAIFRDNLVLHQSEHCKYFPSSYMQQNR